MWALITKLKYALFGLILFAIPSHAQVNPFTSGAGAPSGSCTSSQIYLDTTGHNLYICNNGAWVNMGQGNLSGGGSVTLPTTLVISLSQNCSTLTNCTTTPWNTLQDTTCSWTNGSATVTCSDGPFKAGDVGKRIAGYNTCLTDQASYVNSLGSQAGTTIAAFVSATQVTASNNATATQASAGCIYYGNPDDAGIAAAEALAQASPTCPVLELPAGIGMITAPHFRNNPASCLKTPQESGFTNSEFGYEIRGQGAAATTVYLTPDFDLSTCTLYGSGAGCMGYAYLFWHDFGVTGGAPTPSSFKNLIEIPTNDTAAIERFECTNLWNSTTSDAGGIFFDSNAFILKIFDSNFDGCGGKPLQYSSPVQSAFNTYQDSKDSLVSGLSSSGFSSLNDLWGFSPISNTFDAAWNGTNGLFINASIGTNGATQALRGISFSGNGTVTMINSVISLTFSATSTGIISTSPAGNVILQNTSVSGGSTNGAINGAGGTVTIFDQGGNSIGTGGLKGTVSVFGSASATGTAQTSGNIALTSGWSTSTVGTVSGSSQRMQWTVTAAGTPSASPVITVTFPKAFLIAPLCQYQQEGGTFGVLTNPVITETSTAAMLTFSGTPVAAQTYAMNLECSVP